MFNIVNFSFIFMLLDFCDTCFFFFTLAVFIVLHKDIKANSLYVKTCSAINLILMRIYC